MKISWLINRARRMALPEICWRCREALRKHRDRLSYRPHKVSRKAAELRALLPPLTAPWPIAYFQHTIPWRGQPLPWQNPDAPPCHPTLHWTRINYRDTPTHGDPKQTWELSRHQFLRTWALDESHPLTDRANAISHLILQWIEANPCGLGINWCSSLEVTLRLLSWENAIEHLGDSSFHPRVLRLIHRSVEEHARHLRRFPSLHSSANNHRIGELLGELAAAAITPAYPRLLTAAWQAWQQIELESTRQVSTDGVSREQATWYHIYVLLYFRRAALYADQLGFPKRLEFRQCIEKMQQFLDCMTGDDNHWFEIGDRDDGNFRALRPWREPESLPLSHPAPTGCYLFRDGGYALWKTDRQHILFRAGQFGYPSIAAHAHCDQLSVLLKISGQDILTDSGTGTYHEDEHWRRYFRSTAAHNTLLINSCEQAQSGGPFLWNTSPAAEFLITTASHCQAKLTIPGRPTHYRKVEVSDDSPTFLTVTDTAIPTQSSQPLADCLLLWNFGPAVRLTQLSPRAPALTHHFHIFTDSLQLNLEITSTAPSTAQIYHGDENLPAGFYSRQFGVKEPIYQLRLAARAEQVILTSRFSYQEPAPCAE